MPLKSVRGTIPKISLSFYSDLSTFKQKGFRFLGFWCLLHYYILNPTYQGCIYPAVAASLPVSSYHRSETPVC